MLFTNITLEKFLSLTINSEYYCDIELYDWSTSRVLYSGTFTNALRKYGEAEVIWFKVSQYNDYFLKFQATIDYLEEENENEAD